MVDFYSGLGFVVFWILVLAVCLFFVLKLLLPIIRALKRKVDPFYGYTWNIVSAYRSLLRSEMYLSRVKGEINNEGCVDWISGVERDIRKKKEEVRFMCRMVRAKSSKGLEKVWIEENESI